MSLLAPPPPLRTIIAGSRGITDPAHVRAAMASCPWFPSVVVSGAARGVDLLGERWAAERGIPVESHPADWDKHGKHAGHIRNAEMARGADGLVAVWDGRSPGTRDMIDSARSMGLLVHVVHVVVPMVAPPVAPPAPTGRDIAPLAPLPIHKLPRGTVLRVGPATATVNAEIDFETYSEAGYVWDDAAGKWLAPEGAAGNKKGLPLVGLDNYARHPTAEILIAAFDLKDCRGWRLWLQGQPFPDDLRAHIAAGLPLEAHNAGFEQRMWEHVGVRKYGWPEMPSAQWRCSAAKARAYALPGALGKVGEVLRLDIQKDKAGEALMKKFSMPRNPTKADPRRRVLLTWTPGDPDYEDSVAYARYCVRDIETEAEVSGRCPDLVGDELEWWQFGQEANALGMHLDREGLENCAEIVRQCLAHCNAELLELTGIDAASKVKQITEWLGARGIHMDSLDEEHVADALARADLPPACRRVLEIRAAAGSASVKKVFAMSLTVSEDDRLRDMYVVNGARTGRDIGVGAQPANLPSAGPAPFKCQCGTQFAGQFACPSCRTPLRPDTKPGEWNVGAVEQALTTMALRSHAEVERVWGKGNALHAVAGCLRGLFIAAPGHDLISSDYSSIEAVGMAMVSGEQWRIDTFNTHGKIYEASAATAFGIPFEEMMEHAGWTREQLALPQWWLGKPARKGTHHPLRKKGKIQELANAYQGWVGSAHAFGMPGSDDEIADAILAWRAASPSIEWLWGGQTQGKANGIRRVGDRWDKTPFLFGVEGAFLNAIRNEGVEFRINRLDGSWTGFSYTRHGDVIWGATPNPSHTLKYHAGREGIGRRQGEASMSYEGWNTNPKNGPPGWIRMDTWGGRLSENLIQAICRDILKEAVLRLKRVGYTTVMRTYDEVVCEILHGFGSHEEFERIVEIRPRWALDWPIRAPDSWRGLRYRKA